MPAGPGDALLELSDLTVADGAIVGVRDLNLRVREGEIVALLGANGAGKSWLASTFQALKQASKLACTSAARRSGEGVDDVVRAERDVEAGRVEA